MHRKTLGMPLEAKNSRKFVKNRPRQAKKRQFFGKMTNIMQNEADFVPIFVNFSKFRPPPLTVFRFSTIFLVCGSVINPLSTRKMGSAP
jgi:hypothetical protein